MLDEAKASKQTVDPQSLQFAEHAIEAYEKVLELNPDPEQIGNLDQDLARLALGSAYRQKGAVLFYQGDLDSALSAFDASVQILESVQKVFEASISEHESYRRYLVQTDEYLGTVYLSQISILEFKQDFEQALLVYQKSIDAFGKCISHGKNSPDLIIQNDILEKYCQPKLEETQRRYDELTGGN